MASVVLDSLQNITESHPEMHNSIYRTCFIFPPMINSVGIWGYLQNTENNPLVYTLPRIELQILLVFFVTHALHFIFKRVGLPIFVSQLLTGLILGTAIQNMNGDFQKIMISFDSEEILDVTAGFGFTLFIFLMGVKMDLSMVFRTGKRTFITGVMSLVVPLLMGLVALEKVGSFWELDKEDKLKLYRIVLVNSMTSYLVIACLLSEIKILNSELGRLGLSTALVSDILSLFLATSSAFARAVDRQEIALPVLNATLLIAFVAVVAFGIRPLLFWVVGQTPEDTPVKNIYIHIIILAAVGSGLLTYFLGRMLILGPFIFGLAIPDGPPLGSALVDKLDPMLSGILLPLFVTACTVRVDLSSLRFDNDLMKGAATVAFVVFLTKFTTCLILPLLSKMPKRDALGLSFIMCSNGISQLWVYTFCRDLEFITEGMFAMLVFILLLTAITVPILLKHCIYDPSRIYAGYQRRNIMHSKPNSGLRILPCIYRPDDIPGMINFLEASCPTKDRPIAVYVLHLIKLWGRFSPLFISHQMQKTAFGRSYSENVIISFKHFEEKNPEKVSVYAFTSISPVESMHEDICTLALDKLTSLILLPFDQKFIDEATESKNENLRALNFSVLERAPCSVGILIDRGYMRQLYFKGSSLLSSFRIAMIFFGGSDDREALTLAKRMANDPSNSLIVARFIAEGDGGCTDWEKMHDTEVLKEIKPGCVLDQQINYAEEVVKDGAETACRIRSFVKHCDLVIVGRRYKDETGQTLNLGGLGEFPELGVVGDFLASTTGRYSILVVQQQQIL